MGAKMKRLIILIIMSMVSVWFFTSCSHDKNDHTSLKWITVGTGMPDNYNSWIEEVNPYLEEKIGVNIQMEVVPWGEWEDRRRSIVNSNEYFDILFTDQSRFNVEVRNNVFMDISTMLNESTTELYNLIPEEYWKVVSVDEKIYGVPTLKDCSFSEFFVWDKDIADKYGIDIYKTNDFKSMYIELKRVKEGEGVAPFFMTYKGADVLLDMNFDDLGVGPFIGISYDDNTKTVVNPLEDESILSQLDMVHKMYTEGIINSDAPTSDDTPKYKMVFLAQGWSGAAKTTWGPNSGIENCEATQFGHTVMSNKTIQGSINGIYSKSKNSDKALALLQLINTDTKLRDLFYYGVEGDNFQYVSNEKVERLSTDWTMAGYTQGNFFIISPLVSEEFNQWEQVKELNENANPSPVLGFSPDLSKIEIEVANCNTVYKKYYSDFYTGARDPRELINIINAELAIAGWDKVQKEVQSQIDEF